MHDEIRWQPGHPLDAPLQDSSILSWFGPALALMVQRAVVIAPFALAMALYVWLLPHLAIAGPFDSVWWFHLDGLLRSAVVTVVTVLGFCVLARVEGEPWGHGALASWQTSAIRVAILVVFWYVVYWLISVAVSELVSFPWLLQLGMRVINAFGFWGLYLLIAVLSPLPMMLATVHMLSCIHAVRSEEPLPESLMASFGLVFGQPGRFVLPFMLVTFAVCVLFHLIAKVAPQQVLRVLFENSTLLVITLTVIGTAFTLAWWFVAERALRPDLGRDPDAGFRAGDAAAAETGPGSGTASLAAPTAVSDSTAHPEDLAQQLADLARDAGPVMAARRLVAWLRGRRLSQADYPVVRDALTDVSALAPALAGLALEWRELSRPGELAFVVGEGQRLDRGFLMDHPDQVLATAKRLGMQEQHDLAARLLLPFLDRHKSHPDHAEAGVQMARILAFHRDKPEAGLRLLQQLLTIHPEHPAILAMIRQLENP